MTEPAELILTLAGTAALWRRIVADYPRESCGLLIGRVEGRRHRVERVVATGNRRSERDRFEIDPRELLAATRAARAEGLELLGVWHSHPDAAARPSERDLAGAWPTLSYLIASVTAEGPGALRSWRLAEEPERCFVEERLVVADSAHRTG